jgi:electron transfer flavoprotein alpha subunit
MTTLLIAEHDNASVKDATAKALTAAAKLGGPVHILVAGQGAKGAADAAAKLGGPVHILVAGQGAKGAADAAAKLAGVEKVLLADDAAYVHAMAEPLAALIV